MEPKYFTNVKRGTIHSATSPCGQGKHTKEENRVYFYVYDAAIHYYEKATRIGAPCALCLKKEWQ